MTVFTDGKNNKDFYSIGNSMVVIHDWYSYMLYLRISIGYFQIKIANVNFFSSNVGSITPSSKL